MVSSFHPLRVFSTRMCKSCSKFYALSLRKLIISGTWLWLLSHWHAVLKVILVSAMKSRARKGFWKCSGWKEGVGCLFKQSGQGGPPGEGGFSQDLRRDSWPWVHLGVFPAERSARANTPRPASAWPIGGTTRRGGAGTRP